MNPQEVLHEEQKSISSTYRDLDELIKSHINGRGDPSTNIIWPKRSSFNIPDIRLEEFFALLNKCRQEKMDLHFAERQRRAVNGMELNHAGMMIDLDILQKSRNRIITDAMIRRFAIHVSVLIAETTQLPPDYKYRIVVISKPALVLKKVERKEATTETQSTYKDGLHLLIPEIMITIPHKKYILNQMIQRGKIHDIFAAMAPELIDGDVAKIIDPMACSNPVFFLGSTKVDNEGTKIPPYVITHAFEINEEETGPHCKELNIAAINAGQPEGHPAPINLCQELALSFYIKGFGGNPCWLTKAQYNPKAQIEPQIRLLAEKEAVRQADAEELEAVERSLKVSAVDNADIKLIKQHLDILDITYATDYNKWFKVLCAIASEGVGEEYKNLAKGFSMRCPQKWDAAAFDRIWDEVGRKRPEGAAKLSKFSIFYWARESDPKKYDEIKQNNFVSLIYNFCRRWEGKIEHGLVAQILKHMIGEKFLCSTDQLTGITYWYEFILPGQKMEKGEVYKWRKLMVPHTLYRYLNQILPEVYHEILKKIKGRVEAAENPAEAKYWNSLRKTFSRYTTSLFNNGFQNGIISAARHQFHEIGFERLLDSYDDVIGVGNGVLKVGAEPMLLQTYHELRISKYTQVDYVPFDPANPYVKTLLAAFRDIFQEEDVFEFIMCHTATACDRKAAACILLLVPGGGCNGKTFWFRMIQNTVGTEYCRLLKTSLLTAPFEKSESHNSALMHLKGINYGYCDESNKTDMLNPARVKSIVNPGVQSARDLNARQENFMVTANIVAATNYDFGIECSDHGMWRRIYYYKAKTKFTANPDPANRNEKKEDRRFIYEYVNDPEYKKAMLSIMVHYYSVLCCKYGGDLKNIPVPTIEHETEEFRNRQDTLNRFLTSMIVVSPGAASIDLVEIAARYITWYGDNINRNRAIAVGDVITMLENSRLENQIKSFGDSKYVIGLRIRASKTEALAPHESYLVNTRGKVATLGGQERPLAAANAPTSSAQLTQEELTQLGLVI